MDKAVVLIDGGYLNKICDNIFHRRVYIDRLGDALCQPNYSRFRTYYYNCPPYQDTPPTEDQRNRKENYDRFKAQLQAQPRTTVREGRLRLISRSPFDAEQKGVDVRLACDLVKLAATHTVQKAIIVGGDADFVPAVEIAKEDMILTSLWYVSGNCSPHLWTVCDERNVITQSLIDSVAIR